MEAGIALFSIFSLFWLLMMFVFAAIGIGGTVLWIWMLVECAAYEPDKAGNDKLMWILIIVLTGMIGALIYMIVRRPKRKLEVGK